MMPYIADTAYCSRVRAIASPTVILSLIICLLRVFVIRVMRRGVGLVAPAIHLMAQRQIHAFLLHVGLDAVQAFSRPSPLSLKPPNGVEIENVL